MSARKASVGVSGLSGFQFKQSLRLGELEARPGHRRGGGLVMLASINMQTARFAPHSVDCTVLVGRKRNEKVGVLNRFSHDILGQRKPR